MNRILLSWIWILKTAEQWTNQVLINHLDDNYKSTITAWSTIRAILIVTGAAGLEESTSYTSI